MKRGRHSILHKFLLDLSMTETARELLNDINFIERRIREQLDCIMELNMRCFVLGTLSLERHTELLSSAEGQLDFFEKRLTELQ